MKKVLFKIFIPLFGIFAVVLLSGCTTNYTDMTEDEFWNEHYGRMKGKTDSTYFYQVEMFDTDYESTGINALDEPVITGNFTKILKVKPDASADTTYYYTIRIKQKKSGFERFTKPLSDQLDIKVNGKHVVELNISSAEEHYVSPQVVEVYGYANGYYYVDVMCPIEYKAFVFLANAITIEGKMQVTTTVLGTETKSAEGTIKFISYERPGDSQIVNRFFNSNPTK